MIRHATRSDMRDVYELICCLEGTRLDIMGFTRAFDAHIELTNERHPASTRRVMLVWDEGDAHAEGCAVSAFLNMRLEEQLHHAARVAEVQELVVSPGLRGAGVGKQLIARAMEIARAEGCTRLELVTSKPRTGAQRFYEREGFAQTHFGYTLDLR